MCLISDYFKITSLLLSIDKQIRIDYIKDASPKAHTNQWRSPAGMPGVSFPKGGEKWSGWWVNKRSHINT